jgi:hypothetical protein
MIIKNILFFLIILLGILGGFIASMLALEELKDGRKYFVWLKRTLFFLILLCAISLLAINGFLIRSIVYLILGGTLFYFSIAKWPKKKGKVELLTYLFFLILLLCFAFIQINEGQTLILVSLMLLYGIPTGTLLHLKYIDEEILK